MKNLTLLFFLLVLSTKMINAQVCNTSVSSTSMNEPFCCHTLTFLNNSSIPFNDLRLTPLTSFEFSNVQLSAGWASSISSQNEIIFFPTGGPIPTGSFSPISLCLEKQNSAPQKILVEWINPDGTQCTDTLSLNCDRCIAIDYEDLICTSSGFQFNFDFTNIHNVDIHRIAVTYVSPSANSITPASIDFSSSPITSGSTSTGHSILFDMPTSATSLEFVITAYGEFDCCQCLSDTIRLDLPDCCDNPCDRAHSELTSLNPNDEYCCWTLDLLDICEDNYFSGIKVSVPPNIQFSSQFSSSDWYIVPTPTPNMVIFKPRFTPAIPVGDHFGKINFCLSGINDPSDLPQFINIDWLDMNDQVVCSENHETFCPLLPAGDCIVVLNDTIYCVNDNPLTYQFDWELVNVGNFTAHTIYINNIRTIPASGSANMSPTTLTPLTFNPGDTVTMPSATITNLLPGGQICFKVSMVDTITLGYQNCCHTEELCFTVPECVQDTLGSCDEPCSAKYFISKEDSSSYCCHQLEIGTNCDTIFAGVKLETLNGVQFSSFSVPSNYFITNLSSSEKIVKPRFFNPGYPFLNSAQNIQHINFCLGGIHDLTQLPQSVVLSWFDINGNTICTDTLNYGCEPIPPGDCIIVLNDTVKCEPPGHYSYCMEVKNVGQFVGKYLKVANLHTKPTGGVFSQPMYCDSINLPVDSTFTLPPIHINGASPGDTVCYTISIFDDIDPNTGYNSCCHTDTLCIVLPDCGNPEICDQVFSDTLTSMGDCCYQLVLDNQYSGNYFDAVRIYGISPGAFISSASPNSNYNITPYGTGYEITYTGSGSQIPFGSQIPLDFCIGGYTTIPQVFEVAWLKTDANGELVVECCQGLRFSCPLPPPNDDCFELSEISSTCEQVDGNQYITMSFKLMNNTNLGSSVGYNFTHIDFDVITPSGGNFNPDPLPLTPVLMPGQMNTYTVQLVGISPGQQVHFNADVHLIDSNEIRCCTIDETFCFKAAECDTSVIDPCDMPIDSISYEGWIAVTCGVPYQGGSLPPNFLNDPVVGLIDFRNFSAATLGANWNAPKIMGIGPNNWDFQTLGKVFGLASDAANNRLYVSSAAMYNLPAWQWGIASRPAIYTINLSSGSVTPLIVTNNTSVSQSGGTFTYIPSLIDNVSGHAPAFGNIAYNYVDQLLYAANQEDGVIYAIDVNTGNIVDGFDPWNQDSGNNGHEILGERVFAVQYHHDHRKVYFSRVTESSLVNSPIDFQEIWSVDLLSNGTFGNTSNIELSLPDYTGLSAVPNYSDPVTDISFSTNGDKMLIAERGHAHKARLLEANYISGSWVLSPLRKYQIGVFANNQDNCAGGTDYYHDITNGTEGCDSFALSSGNALLYGGGNYVYGLQALPANAGGQTTQSILVDYDNNNSTVEKNDIGDVETIKSYCCSDSSSSTRNIPRASFVVFPNPTNNIITIQSNDDSDVSSLFIYSSTGVLLNQFDYENPKREIQVSLSHLTSGLYFIKVINEKGASLTKPIVVLD